MIDDLALVDRYRAGDQRAATAIVRAYDWLCRSIARRWARSAADLDDFVQVCRMALVKSLETWTPDKGTLTAHASWSMRHAIRDERLETRTVKIPSWLSEAMDKANSARLATTAGALKGAGLIRETSEVDDCSLIGRPMSIDIRAHHDGLATIGDMLPDHSVPVDERVAETQVLALVWKVANERLTIREMDVFRRRMSGDTLESIGDDYGVTRSAIGQTEQKAYRKILQGVRV